MIILIGGEKGGSGKSTIACNLAVYLARLKKDVLLLDSDPQKTSSSWIYRRSLLEDHNEYNPHSSEKTGDIYDSLSDLKNRYEYIIVDTGGRDSLELRSGLLSANILITPVKPSQVDIDTLAKMDELVEKAKSMNHQLQAFTVITHAPTNPHMDDQKETQAILEAMPQFTPSKIALCYRSSYWRTMGKGISILEYTDNKAKSEILSLGNLIFSF